VSTVEPETSVVAKALDEALGRRDPVAARESADVLIRRHALAPAAVGLEHAVEAFPDDPAFATRLLDVLLRWREWDRFDAWAERVVARFPGRADLRFVTGRAAEERGRTCRAIREYGRASRIDPDDLEPVQRIAKLFRLRDRPFLARRGVRRALKRHPDAAALHGTMGYAYVQDEQYAKAISAFYKAAKLEPDDAPWLDALGGALVLAERWEDALKVASRALRRGPGSERAWTVYAIAKRHLGDFPAAERGYRKAVECSREPTRARGNLGLFLASRKPEGALLEETEAHLRLAFEAHPDWAEVGDALETLRDEA
jgi:Flp pilus assembly protein TadD